ncbi:cold shock domain-containing protein [Candidatus Woesearchaeota archaeon]|nr:cold shock domain-containing protein [Candidatus Woesearchaeota archaeon]MCF7901529.1 cold shock domain-containing protein [Candidatus Woesearchaeota archaeon]MCF8013873.1 cold shock domain-containing protein [Candidatus Woesearchaeota archaeon]
MKGNVKFFNQMKGFGFIAADDGKEYFVHMSDLQDGVTIRDNDAVVFDVVEGDRGLKAAKVSLDSGDAPAADSAPAEEEAEESTEDFGEDSEEESTDDSADDDSEEKQD